jgi:hypothetical protein
MMWMTAWQQSPCGSLPADEEVIAALIGCPAKVWAKHRKALLRGWAEADDGRLYHATITERVLEMREQRDKTKKRVADYKAKLREERESNALPTREQHDKNDTGTGTGTGTINPKTEDPHHLAGGRVQGEVDPEIIGDAKPTQAGAICGALRRAGIADTNPGHPRLLALITAGATEAEFTGFVQSAIDKGAGFAWLLGAVEGERKRAAANAPALHQGVMPAPRQPAEPEWRTREREFAQAITGKRRAEPIPSPTDFVEVLDDSPRLLG